MVVDNLAHIRRASRAMRGLANILLVFIPVACITYWVSFNTFDWPMPNALAGLVHRPLSPRMLVTGLTADALPTALVLYAVYQLRQLFRLYTQGQVLTSRNCRHLRRLSYTMLAWLPVGMLYDAVLSVGVTLSNPPGQHYLSVSLHTMDVVIFLIGSVFLVLTWVMGEGARIAEEQAQIV